MKFSTGGSLSSSGSQTGQPKDGSLTFDSVFTGYFFLFKVNIRQCNPVILRSKLFKLVSLNLIEMLQYYSLKHKLPLDRKMEFLMQP